MRNTVVVMSLNSEIIMKTLGPTTLTHYDLKPIPTFVGLFAAGCKNIDAPVSKKHLDHLI